MNFSDTLLLKLLLLLPLFSSPTFCIGALSCFRLSNTTFYLKTEMQLRATSE
jgi:hypothetical protein